MDESDSNTPSDVARHFFSVIPPLWQSMSMTLRQGAEDRGLVTFPQMRAMAILRQNSASLSHLAGAHEVTPATMSRMISTLVERGWVQRTEDPKDRRQVRLTLTEDGEEAMDALGTRSLDYLADVLAELSAQELAELERSLKALAKVMALRRATATHTEPSENVED